MFLRCNAFVTVMKTAELRDCDDLADTRDLPREGALLVEPQMGPGPMVVTEIRNQGALKMLVFRMTKWFKQSLRIEPIRRST